MTMTGEGISVTPETLREKYEEIAKLDEALDAASGSVTAGRRALANSLASEQEANWKTPLENIRAMFEKIPADNPEQLAGMFNGIISGLDDYKTQINEWLDQQVEKNKSSQEEVPASEIESLTKERKAQAEVYKALRGILVLLNNDVSDIPEPKKRTGARGKRGKRILQGFDFYIDDAPRTQSQNTLSSIANTVCKDFDPPWKTGDLRNFLVEQGIDLENPGDGFTVQLPAPVNKKLSAVRAEQEVDADEMEDDGEDEDDDDAE